MKTYYTPTIEEFYDGFEFQIQTIEHAQWANCLYTRNWKSEDMDIYEWLDSEFDFGVRVKHLDREDIESFKWEFVKEKKSASMFEMIIDSFRGVRRTKLLMSYNSHSNWIAIALEELNSFPYTGMELPLFSGEIKNKSEFNRLLKQIAVH